MSTDQQLAELRALLESTEGQALLSSAGIDSSILSTVAPTVELDPTTPMKRAANGRRSSIESLHQSAIRQHNRLSLAHGGRTHAEDPSFTPANTLPSKTLPQIKIDGRLVEISATEVNEADKETRLFDKTRRGELDTKGKTDFMKAATGYALQKTNKLTLFEIPDTGKGAVDNIRNLQAQLKQLKRHLTAYDIVDVFST